MRSCPVCNHTLSQQRANQAQICAFCGWKDKNHTGSPPLKKDPTYKALSAEEIARQEWKKDKGSLVPIAMSGVGFLIFLAFTFVMVLQQPKEMPPPQIRPTSKPLPTATPTPTPSYTMMPIPTAIPSSRTSPSSIPANESANPTEESANPTERESPSASGSLNALSGSASPLTPPDLPEDAGNRSSLPLSSSSSPSASAKTP